MAHPREDADQIGRKVADDTIAARQTIESRRPQMLNYPLDLDAARHRAQPARVTASRAHRRTLDTATHRTMQDTGPIEPQFAPYHRTPPGRRSRPLRPRLPQPHRPRTDTAGPQAEPPASRKRARPPCNRPRRPEPERRLRARSPTADPRRQRPPPHRARIPDRQHEVHHYSWPPPTSADQHQHQASTANQPSTTPDAPPSTTTAKSSTPTAPLHMAHRTHFVASAVVLPDVGRRDAHGHPPAPHLGDHPDPTRPQPHQDHHRITD